MRKTGGSMARPNKYETHVAPRLGEIADLVRNGATRIHSTWEDIRRLLKAETIEEIVRMREQDPKHYRFWYGGEIVDLEGAVIWSFDPQKASFACICLTREYSREHLLPTACYVLRRRQRHYR